MEKETGSRILAVGLALALVALVSVIILFFQPWRSCDYEDSSAGCAVLPRDATLMIMALIAGAVGMVLTMAGAMLRRAAGRARD